MDRTQCEARTEQVVGLDQQVPLLVEVVDDIRDVRSAQAARQRSHDGGVAVSSGIFHQGLPTQDLLFVLALLAQDDQSTFRVESDVECLDEFS